MLSISRIGSLLGPANKNTENSVATVEHLLIDSRKLLFPGTTMFFAFKGMKTDGHLFISELYNKGVRYFVVEAPDFDFSPYPEAITWKVPGSLKALQTIVSDYRKQFSIPVVGITGSNGKTIIKEWVYQLLEKDFSIVKNPGSYNSQIGVPLSVWQMHKNADLAIFEAGISTVGEMAGLGRVIQPTIGIFTNLGDAHSSGFENLQQKLDEKLLLFNHTSIILCHRDDTLTFEHIKYTFPEKKIISWSYQDETAELFVKNIDISNISSEIRYSWRGNEGSFKTKFKDNLSIHLTIFALFISLELGLDKAEAEKRMSFLSAINMRLETKEGENDCILINDSYNADLTSLTQALNYLAMQDASKNKVLVLSEFFQSGNDQHDTNEKLISLLNRIGLSRLILVGRNMHRLITHIDPNIKTYHFNTTEELLGKLAQLQFQNEVIMMKGARVFHFEDLFDKLAKRFHSTVLEINLDAVMHNIRVYKSFLKPETKMLAVIKAGAYGVGSVKLAMQLEKSGVAYFGVAFMDEGIELRRGGIKNPILIFNPDLNFIPEMYRYRLEPVIYNFDMLDRVAGESYFKTRIHLKIDTGLHRLGFVSEEWDQLTTQLDKIRHLQVASVFSHLSASPNNDFDYFTHQQATQFNIAYQKIEEKLGYKPIKHLLNSAGVVKFRDYQFDMVRVGSGFHGVDTSKNINRSLQIVNTLKAKISLIKKVKAGESIGYERKGITGRERTIAILPIGYADGLVRKAGNERYSVWLNGYFAPIVGNVNMDMTMIDITGIPNVQTGDVVEIFGANAKITDLAEAGETIFYEILTRISPRVKRIYLES
ncbi:MAG TPA: bifunctional UDP-N-acetylmuramoyl-tripeptide:D-alanyl-D-alanine ligase/alanine racemase [Saprospirales bacterium]|nr:bifunctional UDP-N-acetylmuramoyl-tripeptide:D-alanyl-D-alanine ligase/alanine racemase [Saprospirales bacterium]